MKKRKRNQLPDFFDLSDMTEAEFCAGINELCASGLITCTRGQPGADDARYAIALFPLDNPEQFSQEVRDRHAANMLRILESKGSG